MYVYLTSLYGICAETIFASRPSKFINDIVWLYVITAYNLQEHVIKKLHNIIHVEYK